MRKAERDQGNLSLNMIAPAESFPGGSRERVNKAGEAVRLRQASASDYAVIERWRAAHRYVLNSFQALLRGRLRGRGVVVAQRHKRRLTIFGKLDRHPRMRLSQMNDVAGCRLIFGSTHDLYEFREELHAARFKHQLTNETDKYDYIKRPKSDGYRGIHDVYQYDVGGSKGTAYKGLQIELQYRTIYQHAWATCVEVIGLMTNDNPKFKSGDVRYQLILTLASEMIARVFEGQVGPLQDMSDKELVEEFLRFDEALSFMHLLRTLEASQVGMKGNRTNIILIFEDKRPLEIRTFKDATGALIALFNLERQYTGSDADIVLVRGNRRDVRDAFRNYFSDATDFVRYIDEAVQALTTSSFLQGKREQLTSSIELHSS